MKLEQFGTGVLRPLAVAGLAVALSCGCSFHRVYGRISETAVPPSPGSTFALEAPAGTMLEVVNQGEDTVRSALRSSSEEVLWEAEDIGPGMSREGALGGEGSFRLTLYGLGDSAVPVRVSLTIEDPEGGAPDFELTQLEVPPGP